MRRGEKAWISQHLKPKYSYRLSVKPHFIFTYTTILWQQIFVNKFMIHNEISPSCVMQVCKKKKKEEEEGKFTAFWTREALCWETDTIWKVLTWQKHYFHDFCAVGSKRNGTAYFLKYKHDKYNQKRLGPIILHCFWKMTEIRTMN